MKGEVRVVDDVATEFADVVGTELRSRTESTLVLSGGSTATACYQQLAKESVDWSTVSIFWGDERCVPLDHQDSNYLLARTAMPRVIEAAKSVYPMTDADSYEAIVQGIDAFDVVHLGVGDDGHIASLFPGSTTLDVDDRLVTTAGDDLHKHPRITLTYAPIDAAKLVVYTIVGQNKASIVQRIRDGEDLPVNRVRAAKQVWILDKAASGDQD